MNIVLVIARYYSDNRMLRELELERVRFLT